MCQWVSKTTIAHENRFHINQHQWHISISVRRSTKSIKFRTIITGHYKAHTRLSPNKMWSFANGTDVYAKLCSKKKLNSFTNHAASTILSYKYAHLLRDTSTYSWAPWLLIVSSTSTVCICWWFHAYYTIEICQSLSGKFKQVSIW